MQKLTRREKEIFTLLLDGLVPKEIAGQLKISYETVISHQNRLYRKLGVHSIDELNEKFRDNKEKILGAPNGNGKKNLSQIFIKPVFLLSAGIVIGITAATLFFILLSNLKLNPNKNVTQDNVTNNTASVSAVNFDDDLFFTERIYDEVHLRANRWSNNENYIETYDSGMGIRFGEKYKDNIKDLIKRSGRNVINISGSVDKECSRIKFNLEYVEKDHGHHITIAVTDYLSIGPGDFSEIFTIEYLNIDIEALPEGGFFIFKIIKEVLVVTEYYFLDSGDRIPDNMPDGAIWATIRNLKIEPID